MVSKYVLESLNFGERELRARFNNEFSNSERQSLADYLIELADGDGMVHLGEFDMHLDDWERTIPGLAHYW
jgi:hypothetical protein